MPIGEREKAVLNMVLVYCLMRLRPRRCEGSKYRCRTIVGRLLAEGGMYVVRGDVLSGRNAEGHVTDDCDIRRRCIDAFVGSRRLKGYERTRGSMSLGGWEAVMKAHGTICTPGGRFSRIGLRLHVYREGWQWKHFQC